MSMLVPKVHSSGPSQSFLQISSFLWYMPCMYVFLLPFKFLFLGAIELQVDVRVDDHKEDALSIFKQQLQELLVVYTYTIKLKLFSKIYQQRYAKDLDLKLLGADSLESLFQKVPTRKFSSLCALLGNC